MAIMSPFHITMLDTYPVANHHVVPIISQCDISNEVFNEVVIIMNQPTFINLYYIPMCWILLDDYLDDYTRINDGQFHSNPHS
jgi:hypothetical protein